MFVPSKEVDLNRDGRIDKLEARVIMKKMNPAMTEKDLESTWLKLDKIETDSESELAQKRKNVSKNKLYLTPWGWQMCTHDPPLLWHSVRKLERVFKQR